MRILNLYAGLGGNRELWGDKHEITAVEIDKKIAESYKQKFPNDIVIIADAKEYLLKHYKEFSFIWSSPPCQTHSVCNNFLNAQGVIRYPDMSLWQEIIFLQHYFKGKWVVENVKSYYPPFINPQKCGRHYFWANFFISDKKYKTEIGTFNRQASKIKQMAIKKNQIERNKINAMLGLHIFNMAFKDKQKSIKEMIENAKQQ